MELRKAEEEALRLKSEYKALRRRKSSYNNDDGIDLSVKLPTWKSLMFNIADDETLFPSIEQEVQDEHEVTATKEEDVTETADKTSDERDETKEKEEAGYSEWGMLFTGSSAAAADATEDKTPKLQETKTQEDKNEEESDEEGESVVDSLPSDVMLQLQSLRSGFESLQPKTDKFMSRLTEVSLSVSLVQ